MWGTMGNRQAAVIDQPPKTFKTRLGGRYAHIDGLRAFAVMLVVLQHSGFRFIPGPSGVTVFFCISGFIITHILIKERYESGGFDWRGFYAKRALKLAPPFLLAVALPTIIGGVLFKTFSLDWQVFLSQVFFAYNWVQVAVNGEPASVLPGSQVVWSLAVEEQFYIGFALIWLFVARAHQWLAGLGVVAVAGILLPTFLRFWLVFEGASDIRIARATDTRLDAIAWGILGALFLHLWKTGQLPGLRSFGKDWAFLAAIFMFAVGFAPLGVGYEMTFRYTLHAVAALMIILYGLLPGQTPLKYMFVTIAQWRPISVIGLASYSIYLVHYVIGNAASPWMVGLPHPVQIVAFIILGVGGGIALYFLAEVPAHKLKVRLGL